MIQVGLVSLVIGVCALILGRMSRGARRFALQRIGILVALLSIVMISFGLVPSSSSSNTLSIFGIIVSFAFGVGGSRFALLQSSRPRVGVVISSKVAFHMAIRSGLIAELDGDAEIIDLGNSPTAAEDNLNGFLGLLRATVNLRPDYLVIWPPGLEAGRCDEVIAAVTKLRAQGGLGILLQTGSSNSLAISSHIVHDAEEGARLLMEEIRRTVPVKSTELLVIAGPAWSGHAESRLQTFRQGLSDYTSIVFEQQTSWAPEETLKIVRSFSRSRKPKLIVCPNDSCALKVTHAISSEGWGVPLRSSKVVGYDGIREALGCIAEPSSSFEFTLIIPPREYGVKAAELINIAYRFNLSLGEYIRPAIQCVHINVDAKSVVRSESARRQLYG